MNKSKIQFGILINIDSNQSKREFDKNIMRNMDEKNEKNKGSDYNLNTMGIEMGSGET